MFKGNTNLFHLSIISCSISTHRDIRSERVTENSSTSNGCPAIKEPSMKTLSQRNIRSWVFLVSNTSKCRTGVRLSCSTKSYLRHKLKLNWKKSKELVSFIFSGWKGLFSFNIFSSTTWIIHVVFLDF